MGQCFFKNGIDLDECSFCFLPGTELSFRQISRKLVGIQCCAQGHFIRVDFCQLKPEPCEGELKRRVVLKESDYFLAFLMELTAWIFMLDVTPEGGQQVETTPQGG